MSLSPSSDFDSCDFCSLSPSKIGDARHIEDFLIHSTCLINDALVFQSQVVKCLNDFKSSMIGFSVMVNHNYNSIYTVMKA